MLAQYRASLFLVATVQYFSLLYFLIYLLTTATGSWAVPLAVALAVPVVCALFIFYCIIIIIIIL